MQHPRAIDWFTLLWDLIQRGHRLNGIEQRTGIPESTLRRYLDGSQPPHWRGERLIEMWCLNCQKERAELPMTEVIMAPRVVHKPSDVGANEDAFKALEAAWLK